MNKKLSKIRREIKRRLKDNFWLFSDNDILWDGKCKLFFVAEVPSEGKSPENLDNFKKFLSKCGLSRSYVTDLIKKLNMNKNTVKKFEAKFWELKSNVHRDILEIEIKEVDPCLIVAIGNNVEKVLRNPNFNRNIPVEKIRHYSQTDRKELEKDILRIYNIYDYLMK